MPPTQDDLTSPLAAFPEALLVSALPKVLVRAKEASCTLTGAAHSVVLMCLPQNPMSLGPGSHKSSGQTPSQSEFLVAALEHSNWSLRNISITRESKFRLSDPTQTPEY